MDDVGKFRSPAAEQQYRQAYDRALQQCPLPDAVHDIDTRHGTTRLYRFGDAGAPSLVLLPGLMAASPCYAQLLPALSPHLAVYTVDTLGEAGLSVHRRPFSGIGDRARCLDEVLGEIGLDHVHLAGGSTGGWHALNQAIHAPGRVASVTMLDPTTVTTGFSRATIWRGAVTTLLGTDRAWRWFTRWSAGADIVDEPDVQLLLAGIRHYRARIPFQQRPDDAAIRAVTSPVTAVFGGASVVHDSSVAARRLRALLPDSDVEVLPGAGHQILLRQRDREVVVDRLLRLALPRPRRAGDH